MEFRTSSQNEQRQAEGDLRKMVERKANSAEIMDELALKADARDTPSRLEMQDCLFKLDRAQQELQAKLDSRCNHTIK